MEKEEIEKEEIEKEELNKEETNTTETSNDFEKEVETLKAEIAKLKNDYALAYADTENIRKRLKNENETIKKYRAQDFVLEVLPIIDNFERALASEKEKNDGFYKGVEMIYQQLLAVLKKEGVEEVEALNKTFDHNFMQSIASEKKEGVENGVVIEVFQKGYKLKDRILRAAMVKVAE